MVRHLHKISLSTGRVHRDERNAADDERVARSADLLEAVLAAKNPIVVPGIEPQLVMRATDHGHHLSVWLCKEEAQEVAVLRIGIAATSGLGTDLWRMLHANAPATLVTQNESCPPEPWCAVRVDGEATVRVDRDVWGTLHDFERCLAWAYIERPRVDLQPEGHGQA